MAETATLPSIAEHGASMLPAVEVDSYNIELKDDEGFIGDRASKGAFRNIIDNWRKSVRKAGEDPFGKEPSDEISKKALDELMTNVFDRLMTDALSRKDPRQTRFFLKRLSRKLPSSRLIATWTNRYSEISRRAASMPRALGKVFSPAAS